KLAVRGAVGGMASIIPAGKRAYTIQTKTAASNVAGFLLPGNLVDVLLTFRGNANDETGGGSTTLLLQAVEVLAVGSTIEPVGKAETVDAQDVESVTLLVTPEQVARLDLGQTLGMLSLSLRNPNDTGETETAMATISDIRFGPRPPKESAPAANLVTAALPAEAAVEPQPPPAPQRETVATSILTLRGQSWGKVVVAPASHEEPVESAPAGAE
ncbi:MAG TPA: Flp pilus assembly protein CpaB, partial [Pirellulaceae bacterium]|nr:Flp pilus assembly protein CpaB [Pirellulaceae bacterium]